jgi:hypothetical protein
MGGVAVGIPSEALCSDTGLLATVSWDLSNAHFNVLGASDDSYNPQVLLITTSEMATARDGKLSRKQLRRDDDPHLVNYSHSIIVSGCDDGGDYGEYGFYSAFQEVAVAGVCLIFSDPPVDSAARHGRQHPLLPGADEDQGAHRSRASTRVTYDLEGMRARVTEIKQSELYALRLRVLPAQATTQWPSDTS